MESWGFRFEGYKMWCGFISLDQFRFKGRVIEGTLTFDLFLLYSMAEGFFRIKSVVGRPGKDGLDREAMPTLLAGGEAAAFSINLRPLSAVIGASCKESWSRVELGHNFILFQLVESSLFFLDHLLKDLLIPHVLLEPPLIQSLACDCSHSPKKGETRESSAPVHVTNRTSLGPEFCEPPDLDQDLHYVVRYIDPKNFQFFRPDSTLHTIFSALTSSSLGCTKSMPKGATTLTAHLHHHLSFATTSPSSYAYHES
ncbi:hypothetical protein VNO78_31178 [Psophocarpus tetragonolobus]|uniref:Uncharacterized protein n=1 Tax=Psophocarpus tetragonolobus TaxID=3891 RepID=A0AAN9RY55_PSOTE